MSALPPFRPTLPAAYSANPRTSSSTTQKSKDASTSATSSVPGGQHDGYLSADDAGKRKRADPLRNRVQSGGTYEGLIFDRSPEETERMSRKVSHLLDNNKSSGSSFLDSVKEKMRGSMDHHHSQDSKKASGHHAHSATMPSTTIFTRHFTSDSGGVASDPHMHLVRRDSIPESKEEDSGSDNMYSFVVDDPEKAYSQFMQAHRCYDVIPMNAKLVLLDTSLDVSKAFFALVYNSVRAALLWHPAKQRLCGMLTITDFILILLRLYRTEKATIGRNLEKHLIGEWREMLKKEGKLKKLTTVSANTSLYRAVKLLSETMYHRIPVVDEITGNPLYFLTHKRILRFLYLYLEQLPRPSFMHESVQQLGVGTYHDLQYVYPETPLVECLAKLTSRHMSAVPVVERDSLCVVDIYARFDAIGLAAQQSYDNLDKTVAESLQHRKLSNWYEGVLTCLETDTLWEVVKKLVMHEVHGLVVVNAKNVLRGVLTLSDVLRYMVLMPIMEKADSIDEEMNM